MNSAVVCCLLPERNLKNNLYVVRLSDRSAFLISVRVVKYEVLSSEWIIVPHKATLKRAVMQLSNVGRGLLKCF